MRLSILALFDTSTIHFRHALWANTGFVAIYHFSINFEN